MRSERRIVLVQDALPFMGGAERILACVLELFPQAPIYTLAYNRRKLKDTIFFNHAVFPSWVNSLPGAKTGYKAYFPLMPLAVEGFDLREYDLILSFSYAFAHGVMSHPGQLHICYKLTPLRYAWQSYHASLGKSLPTRLLLAPWLHYFRLWDRSAVDRVDCMVASSEWIGSWIWRAYRRNTRVIHPPVEVERFQPQAHREDFYLVCCRLVKYKRVDIIVEAFTRLGLPLKIIGEGPELGRLRRMAAGNIQFLGWQPDSVVAATFGRAKAFVYAAEEDFGIVLAEAQAAGCPVIAYAAGGASEIVLDGETGLLYCEQSAERIVEAVEQFERRPERFDPQAARRNSLRFSTQRFKEEFANLVREQWLARYGK